MTTLWLVFLSIANINNALNIPALCYEESVLNGTACCASLRAQCEFDSVSNFNCTVSPESNLLNLSMSKCGLTGNIPSDITKLPYLISFDLSSNWLEGSIPEQIGEIGKSGVGLKYIDLSANQLVGTIPKSIGDDSIKTSLKYLDLSHNGLTRANLPSITELKMIEHLDLSDNQIAESFHESFGDFPNLKVLNLGINRFSSSIPDTIGQLTQLTVLNLERNDMSGTLPTDMSEMSGLKTLNISDNKFTGTIPKEWADYWEGHVMDFLNLGANEFNCPVLDYSEWGKETDFAESYGEDGESNCYSPDNNDDSNKGLDGVEVAIIVIAVVVVVLVAIYCWYGKRQENVKEQVSLLHEDDVFDD